MNNKVVESFRVKKKLLGGYIVIYKCPHCNEKLTSQESEIRDEEQCPECGMPYYISDSATSKIELLRAIDDDDTANESLKAKKLNRKNIPTKQFPSSTHNSSRSIGLKHIDWRDLAAEPLLLIIFIVGIGGAFFLGMIVSKEEKHRGTTAYNNVGFEEVAPQNQRDIKRFTQRNVPTRNNSAQNLASSTNFNSEKSLNPFTDALKAYLQECNSRTDEIIGRYLENPVILTPINEIDIKKSDSALTPYYGVLAIEVEVINTPSGRPKYLYEFTIKRSTNGEWNFVSCYGGPTNGKSSVWTLEELAYQYQGRIAMEWLLGYEKSRTLLRTAL